VVGLVGLYLTFGHDSPKLTFALSPTRSPIIVAGQSSELRVLYNDTPITQDVTSAQVAFWNDGRRAVEKNDVLEPIKLITEPPTEILEARWRQTARPVCKLVVDPAQRKDGQLPIGFDILEPKDGGTLQVIYAGGQKVGLRVVGVVKGQRSIAEPSGIRIVSLLYIVVYGGAALAAISVLLLDLRGKGARKAVKTVGQWLLIAAAFIAFVAALTFVLFLADRVIGPARPPFTF
jgi:hypothetical protein